MFRLFFVANSFGEEQIEDINSIFLICASVNLILG